MLVICASACKYVHNNEINGVWEEHSEGFVVISPSRLASYYVNRHPNGEECYSKEVYVLSALGNDRYEMSGIRAGGLSVRDTSTITRSGDVISVVEADGGTEEFDKSSKNESDFQPLCALP